MGTRNGGPRALLAAAASIALVAAGFRRGPAQRDAADRDAPAHRRPGATRGKAARAPTGNPPGGWWSVLRATAAQVSRDHLLTGAAGITFYMLLALFPALSAIVSLYGLFADPAVISRQLSALSGVVPGGGMQILTEHVHRLVNEGGDALGLGLVTSLAVSLWLANAATKAIFGVLTIVYERAERRGFLRRTAITLAFTLGAILFVLLTLAAVIGLPVALHLVGFDPTSGLFLRLLRWPLLLLGMGVLVASLFRYGPNREDAPWRWITWGSAFASVGWLLASLGFSFYVSRFGSYNETYGSLGAVVGFMTWLWLSATIVLVGAELDAELERRMRADPARAAGRP